MPASMLYSLILTAGVHGLANGLDGAGRGGASADVSDDDLRAISITPQAGMMSARNTNKRLLRIQQHAKTKTPRQEMTVQLYVLSTHKPSSQARISALTPVLHKLGFPYQVYYGVDKHDYANQAEEMNQQILPMTDSMKKEWLQADFGDSKSIPNGKTPESTPPIGALACTLGHHHIWNLTSQSQSDKQDEWTIILEDDAKLNPRVADAADAIRSILASAPSDVHLIHFDDRHCEGRVGVLDARNIDRWAPGTTAYAVTPHGARMLLSEPFRFGADHYLNVPVLHGKIKAFCPEGLHIFLHTYDHASTMNSMSLYQRDV